MDWKTIERRAPSFAGGQRRKDPFPAPTDATDGDALALVAQLPAEADLAVADLGVEDGDLVEVDGPPLGRGRGAVVADDARGSVGRGRLREDQERRVPQAQGRRRRALGRRTRRAPRRPFFEVRRPAPVRPVRRRRGAVAERGDASDVVLRGQRRVGVDGDSQAAAGALDDEGGVGDGGDAERHHLARSLGGRGRPEVVADGGTARGAAALPPEEPRGGVVVEDDLADGDVRAPRRPGLVAFQPRADREGVDAPSSSDRGVEADVEARAGADLEGSNAFGVAGVPGLARRLGGRLDVGVGRREAHAVAFQGPAELEAVADADVAPGGVGWHADDREGAAVAAPADVDDSRGAERPLAGRGLVPRRLEGAVGEE